MRLVDSDGFAAWSPVVEFAAAPFIGPLRPERPGSSNPTMPPRPVAPKVERSGTTH